MAESFWALSESWLIISELHLNISESWLKCVWTFLNPGWNMSKHFWILAEYFWIVSEHFWYLAEHFWILSENFWTCSLKIAENVWIMAETVPISAKIQKCAHCCGSEVFSHIQLKFRPVFSQNSAIFFHKGCDVYENLHTSYCHGKDVQRLYCFWLQTQGSRYGVKGQTPIKFN